MPPIPPQTFIFEFLVPEILYSISLFIFCTLIYFKTKEIYELTSEKSIRYFRFSFLFLGIAYLSRSVLYLLLSWGVIFEIPPRLLFPDLRIVALFSGFFLAYFGSLSILYLILSLIWRKLGEHSHETIVHILAVFVAFLTLLFGANYLLVSQIIFFTILMTSIYLSYQKAEKKKPFFAGIYPIYILIFVFWVINVVLLTIRMHFEIRLILYTLSAFFVGYIAYRVSRTT